MHSHLHIHMAHAPCPASGAGRYIKHARATRVCGVPSVETIAAALALPPLGAPGGLTEITVADELGPSR